MAQQSKAENPSSEEAISRCVIFYERLSNKPAYQLPKGSFHFIERARPVLELVYQAAKYLGHTFPNLSFVKRAELFYEDDALVEMRVSGTYAIGVDYKDELRFEEWFTPAKPKFSLDENLKLKMARADAGRSYIVVLYEASETVVWWDLSRQYRYEELPEIEEAPPRLKILLQPPPSKAERLYSTGEIPISQIRNRIIKLEAEALTQALIPEPPIGIKELLVFKLSEPHRQLVYIVDRAWVEYKLALRYAQSKVCNQQLLQEVAFDRGMSLDKAKVVWVHNMLAEQIVFVRESFDDIEANIREHSWEVLRDIFDLTLCNSIYDKTFADLLPLGSVWFPLGSVKDKDSDELKKPILKVEVKQAKARLGMRGKGRTKMTYDERGEVKNERTAAIKKAVKDVSLAAKKLKKNELTAEDYVTPAKVAKEIDRSVATLYRWLASCKLNFEDLRSDALKQVYRK